MSEKGRNSPFFRRLITIVLFAGILAALLGLYYLVYLPQQRDQFNERTFRVLKEITTNFSNRVSNYGTAYSSGYIRNHTKTIPVTISKGVKDAKWVAAFKNSFTGNAKRIDSFQSSQRIENETIIYEIRKGRVLVDTPRQSLSDILDPLLSIHPNTFESVLMIKQREDQSKETKGPKIFDSILYRSPGSNIVSISTDSLFSNKNLVASSIYDLNLEGVDYKMFIYPFQVKAISNGTFVLAGLITEKDYRKQSQAVPLTFLFGVGFLIVLMLLILPFLKIFVLSIQENITIADVRVIIAAIFIIPLVITLFVSVLWLYKYPDRFSTRVLSSMQDSINNNFYREIKQCVQQAKDYDLLLADPAAYVKSHPASLATTANNATSNVDAKDVLFYPRYFKNIETVHWMDSIGNDIAVWSFINQPASYFKLRDRRYFLDIRYNRGYILPGMKDTFSIQPALSRLTGEYTINISTASHVNLPPSKKAVVVGISTKMYSLYNTVVPPGFYYCIINDKGDILSHSDSALNLQENLFEEAEDNHSLHTAINHKDSVLIDNININDESVKMLIKPLPGLPYYLVTYYHKRSEYLFIAHILAFVFLSESIILLLVSVFSFSVMMAHKKIYKLLFTPGGLNWLKPSVHKTEYYIKHSVQIILCILLVFLFTVFLARQYYYLYMLNASLLLPLFAVTGYYIIKAARKCSEDCRKQHESFQTLFGTKKQLRRFLSSLTKTLVLYALSIAIFGILQNIFLYDKLCNTNVEVIICTWTLIFIAPLVLCLVAIANPTVVTARVQSIFKNATLFKPKENRVQSRENYLVHFIVSLLLSVSAISVIPAITFTGYALHEERKLHFQTFQLELAKRIQQRRTDMNNKFWLTKLMQVPGEGVKYMDSLKFKNDKGLYLYTDSLSKEPFEINTSKFNNCSPFYRQITQFLFLPPDHDEFFDNPSHNQFYSWKETFDRNTADSLTLSYKNLTDYRDTSSFTLQAGLPHFYIFKDITTNSKGYLVILALIVFIYLFYKAIYSIAKRIFLVGFFEDMAIELNGKPAEDSSWLKLKYAYQKIEDLVQPILPTDTPSTFVMLRQRENDILEADDDGGETILKLHDALIPLYEKIWKDCSDTQKFTLYDFALDGFTNYKKANVLYELFKKGLLIKENENIMLMTKSFRNFLITKGSSDEIKVLSKQVKGSWAILRTAFYIILIVLAVFIFMSQEEASKRLITVVTSLAALLPVMLKLFDKTTFSTPGNKSS